MEPRSLAGMAAFIRRVCTMPGLAHPVATPSPTAQPQPAAGAEPETPAGPIAAPRANGSAPIAVPAPDDAGDLENDWLLAKQDRETNQPQEATVVGWNRGGLLVHWRSLPGFLPASQLQHMVHYTSDLERDAAFASRVGEILKLRIIEVDRARRRLVFSERALQWGGSNGQPMRDDIEPGQVRHGRIRNLCDFGAFVDLGSIDGLIHISEVSWHHIRHPSEVLQIGQEVDVYVMAADRERRRVTLSLKKLRQDPWASIGDRYHTGQVVHGVITNVLSFGAFARLDDGIEGLIHISELAEGNIAQPGDVIAVGDDVTVRVISIDPASRRIALSLRQARQQSSGYGSIW